MNTKAKTMLIVCALLLYSSTIAAWEKLAHAYIADRVGQAEASLKVDQIYGCVAPDIAVFMLGSPYRDAVYDLTHDEFLRLWRLAKHGLDYETERALGFGFVAHNDLWGVDWTAHHHALTTQGEGGITEGYVITKAAALNQILAAWGVWVGLGIDGEEYAEMRAEVCHTLVEYAVDLHVSAIDPGIGAALAEAGQQRSDAIHGLIQTAFAGPLVAYSNRNGMPLSRPEAAQILSESEAQFRQITIGYATIFTLGDPDAIKWGVAQYLTALAYQAYGLVVNPDLVSDLIDLTYILTLDCQAEIEATVDHLAVELAAHGVTY